MSQLPKPTISNYRGFKDYPKIVTAFSCILAKQRFVAPVEVFVEMGLLLPGDLKRWKQGQIPCLERVIRSNLPRTHLALR